MGSLIRPSPRPASFGPAWPAEVAAAAAPGSPAEVGRSAGDDDPLDLTVIARTALALSGVDEKFVLHRAPLAARVEVVVDARAAVVQARLERADDPLHQALGVLELHRPRRRERVQPGPPERLIRVDVPDPGYPRLGEENDLSGAFRSLPAPGGARGELRRERLHPEAGAK